MYLCEVLLPIDAKNSSTEWSCYINQLPYSINHLTKTEYFYNYESENAEIHNRACCWSLRSLNHFHEPSDLSLTWESFPDPYNPKWTQVCKQPPVRIKGNTLDKSIIHLIPSHLSLSLVYIYLPMQHSSYILNEKSFKWFLFRASPIILYTFFYILL